jgi:signal transduction histidine kinase
MEREVLRRSAELDAANRELREANAKLNQLDAAKTAFFNNISHEFRTPLTLMLGPLADSLSDTSLPVDERQRARLQMAYDNSLRLLKLVNALLDFARLEAGRLRGNFSPMNVAALTSDLARMFESAVGASGLRFTVHCPALSEPIWIERVAPKRGLKSASPSIRVSTPITSATMAQASTWPTLQSCFRRFKDCTRMRSFKATESDLRR